jgi:hypothetical protein
MLVKTEQYKKGDVVSIRLSNGEEIMGKFLEEDDVIITLDKPKVVRLVQHQDGGTQVVLQPYMVSKNPDSDFPVRKVHMMSVVETDELMAKDYLSSTSGIALATS